ncbi:hypothetical protein VPNG_04734 [Cytospora leucostoma]|uniref:Uncharacterized protein n=1 Tax=Cytospora leucostoma TaxID=1230097 RepID=A0A423XAC3_9PEZI|nr:hypothetical protein VPNG_04734 [Cytospora leucostoma]
MSSRDFASGQQPQLVLATGLFNGSRAEEVILVLPLGTLTATAIGIETEFTTVFVTVTVIVIVIATVTVTAARISAIENLDIIQI